MGSVGGLLRLAEGTLASFGDDKTVHVWDYATLSSTPLGV
jgi:hypothetical protein